MKFAWSHTRALLIGVALIVVTNAVVLAGVAYNRSGEPEGTLRLTERELRIYNWNWPANENSSIDVHLGWSVAEVESEDDDRQAYWSRELSWLEPAQLRELGFDVAGDIESDEGAERIRRQPSRRAWVVLELDGPAYQTSLEQSRRRLERAAALARDNAGDAELQEEWTDARDSLERQEKYGSRLFVVDAGSDEAALRERYPDRQRYAIVNGRLNIAVVGMTGKRRVAGQVFELDVDMIRVPHRYRELVEPLAQTDRDCCKLRFAATVNFGRRFEPWIADLKLLD